VALFAVRERRYLIAMRAFYWLTLVGCSAAATPTAADPDPDSAGTAPTSVAATPNEQPSAQGAAEPPVTLLEWKRELEVPTVSLALGKRRVAAMGVRFEGIWMLENDRWSEHAFPDNVRAHQGERDELRVFFGRDDRPRVMGTRTGSDGPRGIYLRHRGMWKHEKGEIGRLAEAPAAVLFGILGHDDPEVVCKLGDTCVIKRLTGWTYVPVPDRPFLVEITSAGGAWGVGERALYQLEPKAWKRIDAPFSRAGGLWASAQGSVWVSEPGADALHLFEGGRWTRQPAPVKAPRGMWGAAADDVWVVGHGGAAHYDGKSWRRVAGVNGPLSEVRARGDGQLWLAGESGVWRGVRR
jgi:hypothetical protein